MSDDVKSFTFGSKRAAGAIKLAGQFDLNGERYDVRVLKNSHISFLVAKVKGTNKPDEQVVAFIDFMHKALTPESAERFEAMVLDPDAGLEMDEVLQVFHHVVELVGAGNPTGPSSASSSRRPKAGAGSQAASRAKA